jgi:hypothetical protein
MTVVTDEDVEARARELFEAEREPDRSWDMTGVSTSLGAPTTRPLTDEEKEVYLARAREQLSKGGTV